MDASRTCPRHVQTLVNLDYIWTSLKRTCSTKDGDGHDDEQEMLALVDSLKEYGETVASGVVKDGYGAYSVEDDPEYDYYVCQWTDKPFQAQADKEIYVGEDDEPTRLIEGDWYCRGIWLTKLPWAKNWWTMDGRECLVRMQQVLHSSLPLVKRSESNPFRRGVPSTTIDHADVHGAWRL